MARILLVGCNSDRYKRILTPLLVSDLGIQATAVHMYLVARGSIKGWDFHIDDMVKMFNGATRRAHTGIKELEEKGWLYRCRHYKSTGQVSWIYLVFFEPISMSKVESEALTDHFLLQNIVVQNVVIQNIYIYLKEYIDKKEDKYKALPSKKEGSASVFPTETRRNLLSDNSFLSKKKNRPSKKDILSTKNEIRKNEIAWADASDKAKGIVSYWNSLSNTTKHSLHTHTVRKSLFVLDDKILSVYDEETIFSALNQFNEMLEEPGKYKAVYTSTNNKPSLQSFLVKDRYGGGCFYSLLVPDGYKALRINKDQNPKMTNILISKYKKHILADNGVSFTASQNEKFITASSRLVEYMLRDGKPFRFTKEVVSLEDYAEHLLRSLVWAWGVESIQPGNLSSKYTFDVTLPQYAAQWAD